MQTCTDTLTGKQFRYNAVVILEERDGRRIVVPAREGKTFSTYLHYTRVPRSLLEKLNPGVDVTAIAEVTEKAD